MRSTYIRFAGIVGGLFLLVYLLPALLGLSQIDLKLLTAEGDGFITAFSRSILVALSSTMFNILLGLTIGLGLRSVPLDSRWGKALALLLLPILLGNVSVAFLGKILLTDVSLIQQSPFAKFFTIVLLNAWQYGFMFGYMFWLAFQNLAKTLWDYSHNIRMSPWEKTRDMLLPPVHNLSVLLFILNFTFVLYEESKALLLFRFSQGSHTEMASQWLGRYHASNTLISPTLGNDKTLGASWLLMGLALVGLVVLAGIFYWMYDKLIKSRGRIGETPHFVSDTNYVAKAIVLLIGSLVLGPILFIFVDNMEGVSLLTDGLGWPILLTSIAAFVATAIAVGLGILWRLGWRNTFSRFQKSTMVFFVAVFLLQLIPPLAMLIAGFKWLRIFDTESGNINIVWTLGHILLVLPLLSSFVTVAHFRVKNIEIDFWSTYQRTAWEWVRDSFLRRFAADYLLTFLFAFSLIWNEGTINNLFSDVIPSFVSNVKMVVDGKGLDFAKGLSYMMVSMSIAVAAISLWTLVLSRAEKAKS